MTVSEKVTRLEIAEAVGGLFDSGGADRAEILAAVGAAGGRPELIDVLSKLPVRRYGRLNQLWEELDDIPVGV